MEKIEFKNIYTLDCEATSLSNNSYPIEIGWSSLFLKDKMSFLINLPQSCLIDWNKKSEEIHKINILDLKNGLLPHDVCHLLNDKFSSDGIFVFSDNPYWENKWIRALFDLSKIECKFVVFDYFHLYNSLFLLISKKFSSSEVEDIVSFIKDEIQTKYLHLHRAGPDSYQMAVILYFLYCKYNNLTPELL